MALTLTASAFKRELIKLYNEVNQEMYAVGVKQQRVDLLGDKIVIVAEHQRIPALAALDSEHRGLTRMVDAALLDEYRRRMAERIGPLLPVPVRAILKDYDPVSELAATVICLEAPITFPDK